MLRQQLVPEDRNGLGLAARRRDDAGADRAVLRDQDEGVAIAHGVLIPRSGALTQDCGPQKGGVQPKRGFKHSGFLALDRSLWLDAHAWAVQRDPPERRPAPP